MIASAMLDTAEFTLQDMNDVAVKRGKSSAGFSALGGLFSTLVAALLFPLTAHAAEPFPMHWTPEHEQMLASGDAAGGKELSAKCDRCHGENGVSRDTEMPHLAGQHIRYLYKQLQDFKSKARVEVGMNKRARKLSDKEMADLAAWYSALELPPMLDERELPMPTLVADGDPARGIPACRGCHGEDGRGISHGYDAPSLAGMPYDYFLVAMAEFRDGTRTNDRGAVVRQFATKLSEDEVKQLAEYYLALGRRERPPLQ